MVLQSSGVISINDVNQEFLVSPTRNTGLRELALGWVDTLNEYNDLSNIQATPYSLGDWYGYDHHLIGCFTDPVSIGYTAEGHNFTNLVVLHGRLHRDFVYTQRDISPSPASDYHVFSYGFRYRIGTGSWTEIVFFWNGTTTWNIPYPEIMYDGTNSWSYHYVIGTLIPGQTYEYQAFLYQQTPARYFFGDVHTFTVGAADVPYIEHGSYYGDHRITFNKIWVDGITKTWAQDSDGVWKDCWNAQVNTWVVSMGTPTTHFDFGTGLYESVDHTSGVLSIGSYYMIGDYNSDDDFTNIGAPSNMAGIRFLVTGTGIPAHWVHGSLLRREVHYPELKPINTANTTIDPGDLYGTNWHWLTPNTTYYWVAWLINGLGQEFFFGPQDSVTWEHFKFTTLP